MPGPIPAPAGLEACLPEPERLRQREAIRGFFAGWMQDHGIPTAQTGTLADTYLRLAAWIQRRKGETSLRVGINGAQGSGKSTLCDALRLLLESVHGYRVAGLSIDDFYRTRAERQYLAETVHPLLATRGVPGTHDVSLAMSTLDALEQAGPGTIIPLPAFDKGRDDRRPESGWPRFTGRPDIIILEGWCVGSSPQPETALTNPVNDLERNEDSDGRWRHHVNAQLQGPYASLFGRLDCLLMLKVPGMAQVFEWRNLQEQKLAASHPDGANRIMDEATIRRFIMHYERLTRHNLEEMPARADLTLYLDESHRFARIEGPAGDRKP